MVFLKQLCALVKQNSLHVNNCFIIDYRWLYAAACVTTIGTYISGRSRGVMAPLKF